jgi:LuxR family maltose regulon positive regulatory protein
MSRALALVDSAESRKSESPLHALSFPLLETKLHVPKAPSGLVERRRLLELIREGAARRLTVIVAPAGFGKTTLASAWLAHEGQSRSAAWVSLDPTENDPVLFWAYVITTLQRVGACVGNNPMALLHSGQAPMDSVLTALINDVTAADRDVTLVLDDYHVIEAPPVHAGLTFLLDHLPPRMHVVITTRVDPPLALARLRARGELVELRAPDLRFTADEVTRFLNEAMSLRLSSSDAARLEQRTEGWITGLKLAALSLQRREDMRGFVDAFSGDNRYIADYLVDEVLRSEPEHVARFLLDTAILDRLSGPLCDATTGENGSQALLEDLERRSLFIVALDDTRTWFRYHQLFADVLRKQALRRDGAGVRAAHGRASAWHATHGARTDAVQHALAAEDFPRAAQLLEQAWPEKDRSYESRRWLDRVRALPQDLVRARPVLSMGYAWALMNSGELEAAEPRLRDVEGWLETHDDARLRTEAASARVYLTQSLGDVPGTLEHARRALELVPAHDIGQRATATALLALAHWGRGELDAAHGTFGDALGLMRQSGHDLDVIRGIFVLGDIRAAQGRLRAAAETYRDGLRQAAEGTFSAVPETDELHLGLSEVHREMNDLDVAVAELETLSRKAAGTAHKGNRLRWCTAMAWVHAAQGDFDAALQLLSEAELHERRDPLPRARPIPAMKARMLLVQGRAEDAAAWVPGAKVSPRDDLSYVREYEHITLARILVVTDANAALALLERLQVAAQTGGRLGSVIEILVLQSLAQQGTGNVRGAMDVLGEALALAAPEGFMRVFLDEGTRIRDLLRTAVTRGLAGEYARTMLAAFELPKHVATSPRVPGAPASVSAAASSAASAAPGQTLTTRELEILRLIAAGLRNQEIADHLDISAATVKRHIANAYGKLGVGHRTEALARAKELNLL